jgi:hypothetical protein
LQAKISLEPVFEAGFFNARSGPSICALIGTIGCRKRICVAVLILSIVLCAIAAIWAGLSRPGGYISVPALFGAMTMAFVVPQLLALEASRLIRPDFLTGLQLMVLLCFMASVLGWYCITSPNGRPIRLRMTTQARPYLVSTVVLTLAMLVLGIYQRSLGAELSSQGITQWTGVATIVAFGSSLRPVALTLSLLLVFKRPTVITFCLAATNFLVLGSAAFIELRRSEMIDLGISVLAALWFAKRVRIPTYLFVGAAAAMALVTFGISELRTASRDIEIATGKAPSLFDPAVWNSTSISSIEKSVNLAPDFVNAAYLIGDYSSGEDLRLGALLWNGVVHQWVPAQFLGSEFKRSLMIGATLEETFGSVDTSYVEYEYWGGTTATGFGSAFGDFGFFGAGWFFLIGAFLAKVHRAACEGDVWSQSLFPALVAAALICFTHQYYALFVMLPLLYGAVGVLRRIDRLFPIPRAPVSLPKRLRG